MCHNNSQLDLARLTGKAAVGVNRTQGAPKSEATF